MRTYFQLVFLSSDRIASKLRDRNFANFEKIEENDEELTFADWLDDVAVKRLYFYLEF